VLRKEEHAKYLQLNEMIEKRLPAALKTISVTLLMCAVYRAITAGRGFSPLILLSLSWFIACPVLINQKEFFSLINNEYKLDNIELQNVINITKKNIPVGDGKNELNLIMSVLQMSLEKRPGAVEFEPFINSASTVIKSLAKSFVKESKEVLYANARSA